MTVASSAFRIAFLGDSISEIGRSPKWHGGASSPDNNWSRVAVSRLRETTRRPIEVANFGIGGQNTYEGLGRVDSLAPFSPHLVVVAFGANDCCHHFLCPEETKLALTSLVEQITGPFRADVVVVGTGGDNPKKPFFRHLEETLRVQKEAARECSVPFVDVRAAILHATRAGVRWADYHLAEDNCHPNDEGHQVWASALVPAVENWIHAHSG